MQLPVCRFQVRTHQKNLFGCQSNPAAATPVMSVTGGDAAYNGNADDRHGSRKRGTAHKAGNQLTTSEGSPIME